MHDIYIYIAYLMQRVWQARQRLIFSQDTDLLVTSFLVKVLVKLSKQISGVTSQEHQKS